MLVLPPKPQSRLQPTLAPPLQPEAPPQTSQLKPKLDKTCMQALFCLFGERRPYKQRLLRPLALRRPYKQRWLQLLVLLGLTNNGDIHGRLPQQAAAKDALRHLPRQNYDPKATAFHFSKQRVDPKRLVSGSQKQKAAATVVCRVRARQKAAASVVVGVLPSQGLHATVVLTFCGTFQGLLRRGARLLRRNRADAIK